MLILKKLKTFFLFLNILSLRVGEYNFNKFSVIFKVSKMFVHSLLNT